MAQNENSSWRYAKSTGKQGIAHAFFGDLRVFGVRGDSKKLSVVAIWRENAKKQKGQKSRRSKPLFHFISEFLTIFNEVRNLASSTSLKVSNVLFLHFQDNFGRLPLGEVQKSMN